ncbi:metal-dependent phosphohydrolase [Pseudomonas protegens CHA0]|uniref:Metal-dependent phosphohydrolase n=2 Tax=Pseudomonas protegens TaxID=380021 RepID=A0A2C9ELI6_PSEPH|nr:metal-dependent phosphohydrolase [Pseudomonas protegens CHA0]
MGPRIFYPWPRQHPLASLVSHRSPPFSAGCVLPTRAGLSMNSELLSGRLDFLREAEKLKDVLRSAHTSSGRQESTAEHSWRLCLMALLFEDQLGDLDLLRVLKLCIVHDLGEAIHGDIPAVAQAAHPDKSQQERDDLQLLARALDAPAREHLLELWDEYEGAASNEARAVKALDKLETLLQHTQGQNPAGFDYRFNLGYGRRYTDASPLFQALRQQIDIDTQRCLDAQAQAAVQHRLR